MKSKSILILLLFFIGIAPSAFSQPLSANAGTGGTICLGSNLVLNGSGSFGTPPYTFAWLPAASLSNPSVSNPTATPTSSTTYTLTVTDAVSATATSTVIVSVNPLPTTPIAGNNGPLCSGGNLALTASNVASVTYSWTGPNGFTSSLQNPTIAGASTAASGSYSVVATSTMTGCPSAPGITSAVINAYPTVLVNSPSICSGATTTLTATGASTYSWNTGATTSSIVVSPGTTTAYTVNGTASSGCASLATATVTVYGPPSAPSSASNAPVCEGDAINLSANTIAGVTYTWSGPNGFTSALQNPGIPAAAISDAGTYSVYVTDVSTGCTSTASGTNVVVNSLPIVTVNSPGVCSGTSATLNAAGALTYAWSTGGTTASISVSPATSTTYTVSGTGSNGCTGTATSTVTVFALPNVTSTNVAVCAGSSGLLSASGALTYSWSTGATTASISDSPGVTSTYTVTGTDANGCTAAYTATITVLPPPTASPASSSPVCDGFPLNLTANFVSGGTYAWSGPAGFTSTLQNPTISPATLSAIGNYTLVITQGSCVSAAATTSVNVIPLPPVFPSSNSPVCEGQNLSLSTSTVTGASYSWSGPNGFSTTLQNPSVTAAGLLAAGNYTLTVTANGCSDIGVTSVTINAMPVVSTNAVSMCQGDTATLSATGALSYLWSTAATTAAISVSPGVTTNYSVIGTDANGCNGYDTTTVTVTPSTDITGLLSFSTGNVTTGNVYLISQGVSSALFDTVAVTSPNGSGNYTFSAVQFGNYYVRSEANATNYPNLINTYYGDVYLWDSATVVTHGCAANNVANITMVEVPAISGPGFITGVIYEGAGFGQKIIPGFAPMTNVIPGVPVKVGKNPGGAIVASGVTDINGRYTFPNLPYDDYRIYTDIPGYPMDSTYSITLSAASDSVVDLDYLVDSNSVEITLLSSVEQMESQQLAYLNTFPNPAKENVTINFEVGESAHVRIEMYNLQGEKINVILNRRYEKGKFTEVINLNQLGISNGTYMLRASVNNNNSIIKLVVLK
jgi:hypothetical protein